MSSVADASEVLSGEAVAIDVQPVGFFMRALGALIDMLVTFAVILLGILLMVWMSTQGMLTEAIARILWVVTLATGMVVVPCTLEVLTRGRSLGKLAIGGRIVRIDGGTTGFRHAFIRALTGVLEIYFTLGAGAILAGAFSARSQRLGDMIAGTYSQRLRATAPRPHVPIMPATLAAWAPLADVARLPDRLARRIGQFLQNADQMTPDARVRIAHELADQTREYVSPQPSAPPEQILIAMTILRREREHRALRLADERMQRLIGQRR